MNCNTTHYRANSSSVPGDPTDFEAGARYYRKASELDPGFARAYAGEAMDQAYMGRFAEARRTIDRCLVQSPAATACLWTLGLVQSSAGECDGLEATARRMVAAGSHHAYHELAYALAARGKPISTVREALRQAHASTSDEKHSAKDSGAECGQLDVESLELFSGDFEAAEKQAREIEKSVAEVRRQEAHGYSALTLADILIEQGRDKEAGAIAMDFLDRRDAWEPNPSAEDIAMGHDAAPSLFLVAQRGGRMGPAEIATKRAAWLESWNARVTPVSRNFLWLHGWARSTGTEADARAALAALPTYEPLPPFRPVTPVDVAVGRTFLLGGRTDDAITWLEQATRSCTALSFPIEHTRAHLALGQAREAKGDTKGACAAYGVVLERWGKAKPRSVTADKARTRAKALGCTGVL